LWTAIERLKTMAHTETKVAVSCSPGSDEEVFGLIDGPGGVEGGIGAPKHELIVRDRLVVEDGEKNIKNGQPGEGTTNFPLPLAPFRIEGDVKESVDIQFGEGAV